jgi:hypothetical protein
MSVDVTQTSIRELATVTARGLFALAFPLLLFSLLAGVAAGVAVACFQFTLHLLGAEL